MRGKDERRDDTPGFQRQRRDPYQPGATPRETRYPYFSSPEGAIQPIILETYFEKSNRVPTVAGK